MSWMPDEDPKPGDKRSCDAIEQVIVPRARALIRELAEDPLPDERLSLLTATALLGLGRG